ncbi:hypothetical protein MRY87_11840 [bacterium]|nr:hypothetical protein [bacterium]
MKLKAFQLDIPFRETVSHASATRQKTESFLVLVYDSDELIGIGEGCPRAYVTGESLQSCYTFFHQYCDVLEEIRDLEGLKTFISSNCSSIEKNPAAWCAIELAILDAFAKQRGETIEQLLSLKPLEKCFQFDGVLDAKSFSAFTRQVKRYEALGITRFKLKLSGDLELDQKKVCTLSRSDYQLRVDANNLWSTAAEVNTYLEELGAQIIAIEEPVGAKDFTEIGKIEKPVILDESFTGAVDLSRAPTSAFVNLRISKLGGILRTLELARKAQQRGLKLVMGCQVGETSILTRAALCVSSQFSEHITAREGAFSVHLLTTDITEPFLCFGEFGMVHSGSVLKAPGLGLELIQDTWACMHSLSKHR